MKPYWEENGWKPATAEDDGDNATDSDTAQDDDIREANRQKRVAESGTWEPSASDFLNDD